MKATVEVDGKIYTGELVWKEPVYAHIFHHGDRALWDGYLSDGVSSTKFADEQEVTVLDERDDRGFHKIQVKNTNQYFAHESALSPIESQPVQQSQHEAGEPFRGLINPLFQDRYPEQGLEYISEVRKPKETEWYEINGVACQAVYDFEEEEYEILRPRQQKPQFKVGELVVRSDNGNLSRLKADNILFRDLVIGEDLTNLFGKAWFTELAPGVKFRAPCAVQGCKEIDTFILTEFSPLKAGDIHLPDTGIVGISAGDHPNKIARKCIPLPLDYWKFSIEGVECVAYKDTSGNDKIRPISNINSDYQDMFWSHNKIEVIDLVMDSVAADYEREHGVPLPIIPAEYVDVILKGE